MKTLLKIAVLLIAASAAHAQTVTANMQQIQNTNVWALIVRWTAASDGTVPPTPLNSLTPTASILGYRLIGAEFTPLAPSPTNLYNIQLQDSANVDMLVGAGAALNATVATSAGQSVGAPPMFGTITFVMTGNNVANASGQVIIYFAPVQTYSVFGATGPAGASASFPAGQQLQVYRIAPNTGNNTTVQAAPLAVTNPSDFVFPAQTPGGSLTGSVAATVTLTPCPLGVNGADSQHWLYLTGGTGTPEYIRITGGTCTSGASSGTITFTPVNSHSGNFTVTTATAGAAEALLVNKHITFNPGTYVFNGPLAPPTGSTIECGNTQGAGVDGGVILQSTTTNQDMFIVNQDAVLIHGCQLQQVGTPTSGAAIHIYGGGSSASPALANNTNVNDVAITGFYNGVNCDGGGGSNDMTRVRVSKSIQDGLVSGSCQGWWNIITSELNGRNGLTVQAATGAGGGFPTWFGGYQAFGNVGWGAFSGSSNFFMSGTRSYFNADQLGGLYMNGAGLNHVSEVDFQFEGLAYAGAPYATNPNAVGLFCDSGCNNSQISNTAFYNIQGTCMEIAGAQNTANDIQVQTCNVGGSTGITGYGVRFVGGGITNAFTNAQMYGASLQVNETDITLGNLFVENNSSTFAAIYVAGGSVIAGNLTAINGGSANAFLCSGATLTDGIWALGGTVNNTCTQSGSSFHVVPIPLPIYTSGGSNPPPTSQQTGSIIYVTNYGPGNPCAAGTGSIAVWSGAQWNCPGTGGGGGGNYQTVKNNGTSQPPEPALNLIAGANTTLTFSDSSGISTNVTIASTGGGGGGSLPGQTGTDFAMSVITTTTANDSLLVSTGNYLFGGNPFPGTNSCTFTLTGGSGAGVADVWLTRSGLVTMQYTNTGSQTISIQTPTTNCVATGAATPAFPADGSKYIGTAVISGATVKTFTTPVNYASLGGYYLTTCTLPMICAISGDTVNVSGANSIVQTNQANAFTSAGSLDLSLANGFKVPFVTTTADCSSAASPAVCGAAMAGSVAVAGSATTLVVDTTAVTAASQIIVTFDSSLGTRLSVTCNTTYEAPWVSARTAATSFTVTLAGATSNPACLSYLIIN